MAEGNTDLQMQANKEEYLAKLFALLKKRGDFSIASKNTFFNRMEIQLIGEVILAKREGRRLFASQLAKILGITRSAVSHIVKNLERKGVVVRVASLTDKKIEYVEITQRFLGEYKQDMQYCLDFTHSVVKEFGEENFFTLCELFDRFAEIAKRKMANK